MEGPQGPQGKKEEPGQVPSAPTPPEGDEGKAWVGALHDLRRMEPCPDCGELRRKLVEVCPHCEGLRMRRDAEEREKVRLAHYVRDVDSNLDHRERIEQLYSGQLDEIRRNRMEVVAAIDRQTSAFERVASALEEFVKPRIKVIKRKR